MKHRALFLMCGAVMALAASAACAADASSEDGVMAPEIVAFDLAAPTALPGFDETTIYLAERAASVDPIGSVTIAPRDVAFHAERGSTTGPPRPHVDRFIDREVATAEGVPKSS